MTSPRADKVTRIAEARARRRAAPPASTSGPREPTRRRRIVVDADLHLAVADSAAAIADHPRVYQRDAQLVHVVRPAEPEAGVAAGAPILRALGSALLRSCLSEVAEYARPSRDDDGESRQIAPPADVAAALIELGQWPGVRPIVGVIEAPYLRVDGTIAQTPGYDPQTGYLYEPSATFPDVPAAPTQADARRALAELAEIYVDFPFATEAARSVPLAAILTMLARPAIQGAVPAFIIEANTRGSGKSLASNTIGIVATGRATAKMSWPPDPVELEKVLASYALRGASLIDFDNVVAPFGGGPLDRCLTATDRVELRVLGKSEIPSMSWRAVVLATGNNIALAGDTARRVVVCRIESPLENPEDRSDFRHPDLLGWLARERPRLVAAALTILRGWVVAGRPRCGCPSWGSFEAWAVMIPPALVWAGAADPMGARPAATGHEDADKAALEAILEGLSRLDGDGRGLPIRDIVTHLYADRPRGGGAMPPDGYDALRDALEHVAPPRGSDRPDARQLGNRLRRLLGRVVGGRRLVLLPGRSGVVRWAVCGPGGGGSGGSGGSLPTQGTKIGNENRSDRVGETHQTHQTHHDEDDPERAAIVAEGAAS